MAILQVLSAAVAFLQFSLSGSQEIAFSAGLSHHEYLQASEKVVYDTIFTNVGGGYSTNTGIFTCPQAGIYVFQFNALSHSNSNMWLELHRNYNYVASIWGHIDNDYASAGNSVILRLAKHDQVYITTADKTDLYGKVSQVYGTFSGFLISSIEEGFPIG